MIHSAKLTKYLGIQCSFCIFVSSKCMTTHNETMENKELEAQFEQLVRKHRTTIYTVCYMFSADAQQVADLFQETLINLWKGYPKFKGQSELRTWIYRVSLNTCITVQRQDSRRPHTIPLAMDIDLFSDNDNDTRQVDLLHQRISRLPPLDRAIVLLWLEGLPYEEIGQICGLTTKNISVRLYRIKEQLKRMSNPQ